MTTNHFDNIFSDGEFFDMLMRRIGHNKLPELTGMLAQVDLFRKTFDNYWGYWNYQDYGNPQCEAEDLKAAQMLQHLDAIEMWIQTKIFGVNREERKDDSIKRDSRTLQQNGVDYEW